MKNAKSFPLFVILAVGAMFFALGCEDRPDTENVDGFFDGRDVSADTSIRPRSPQQPDEPLPALAILPDGDITLDTNTDVAYLTLSGAQGAVDWSVSKTNGVIVESSDTAATYKRDAPGDNVVIATDSAGRTEFKVIKQP